VDWRTLALNQYFKEYWLADTHEVNIQYYYCNKCAKAINRRFSSIERRIDYEEAGLFQNAQSVRYIEKHFTMNDRYWPKVDIR